MKNYKQVLERGKNVQRFHTQWLFFFLMLSERKSWSNDFWNGERHWVSERKRTEQRWEDQTSQQLSDEQGTEVTTRRGGGFLSLCRRRGAGFGRGAVGLLGQRRPEGTTTHILLLLCWGRREGWRNNLDGLGLIKEKERNRQKNSTHCKIKSSGLGFLC